jgi:hypothetical protein
MKWREMGNKSGPSPNNLLGVDTNHIAQAIEREVEEKIKLYNSRDS